ncbi:hypothetical protein MVEN_00736700 [Mycena venus]|uniref:CAP-Gly domain-containing protein n=1 Tax=Mycena venus TaxID=2733690 RepID=A0A8H7D5X0_9AGAR|nr:hypothetical protein MVEN_00736700 [Mycena venus]
MAADSTHALSLQEATRNSTSAWQQDLASLFQHAKERFPDVVWELTSDSEDAGRAGGGVEEVWGHKAIVYARAPPSFQSRYFSFRPHEPLAASALSLDIPRGSRSPSPFSRSAPSPAPSTTVGGLTRLTTSINPALFSNELEYLYTGQGFGEAFGADESATVDGEELRIDKLRKDLVFMWRSRLYSDVRIALTSNGPPPPTNGNDDEDAHERQMPVFSSHRFILASRSPYFHTALVSWPSPSPQKALASSLSSALGLGAPGEPLTLSLPSPPFTPASLHFTLGFLYTGTLIFSHRTYDLSTALALLLSANYLQLPTLHAEVQVSSSSHLSFSNPLPSPSTFFLLVSFTSTQARIISEMTHGLFHAALPFAAYEELTRGAWRAGGCTCRKCAARVPRCVFASLLLPALLPCLSLPSPTSIFPLRWWLIAATTLLRILEFALRPDVTDPVLERGARRALVGLFGTGVVHARVCRAAREAASECVEGVFFFVLLYNGLGFPSVLLHHILSHFRGWRPAGAHSPSGLSKRSTPANALPILWAAEGARARLAPMVDAWADTVRGLIDAGRAQVDAVMANQTAEVLAESDFSSITRADGVRFEDGERVEWAMRSIVRGVGEGNAGRVYQALVNVLLLPHPEPEVEGSFPAQPLLSQTSHVRVQLEQARMDVLNWIKRGGRGRADRVAREGGLDGVEAWAVREIGDFLEIAVDDLLSAIPPAPGQHPRQPTSTSRKSTALLSAGGKDADQHSLSIHTQQSSMRVSVLSRSIPTPRAARSVRKETREEAAAQVEEEVEEEEEAEMSGERPDSKLTPEMGAGMFHSLEGAAAKGKGRANGDGNGDGHSAPPSPTVAQQQRNIRLRGYDAEVRAVDGERERLAPPQPRPRSAASSRTGTSAASLKRPGSAASGRSTSTVRTTRGLRPPLLSTAGGAGARRASGASTSASASVSEFRTALSGSVASRSRQSSVSSVASKNARTPARSRKTSNASDVSVRTTGASTSTAGGAAAKPPVPTLDPAVRKRGTPSIRSVRSVASSTSTMDTAASAARKAAAVVNREKRPETKVITLKQRGRGTAGASAKEKEKEKGKEKPTPAVSEAEEEEDEKKDHRKTDSTTSTASASTLRVKRKGSGDTVSTVTTKAGAALSTASGSTSKPTAATKSKTTAPPPKRPAPAPAAPGTLKDLPMSPRGATLDIGIPCIIASKRKRFKAFARYIGEVEGEAGPWVGVEVPASAADGIGLNSSSGRQWHDGSWGGIRYFEIGGAGSEWEYGDEGRDRAARRRRLEGSGASGYGFGGTQKGIKREGDSLGGARGAKRIRSASPAVSDADGAGESRGLFVRPSAVLYVVDAVGADL